MSKLRKKTSLSKEIDNLSEEALQLIAFSSPWQYGAPNEVDADGFGIKETKETELNREALQSLCWNKFFSNPQVNTSVRGLVGRLTGYGFEMSSSVFQIQEVITEILLDPRNRLFENISKYVTRSYIEGELHLCLTVHKNGFIEIDFIDPASIEDYNGVDDGIIFHPNKQSMPLAYCVKDGDDHQLIPSIFLARYPELVKVLQKHDGYKFEDTKGSRSNLRVYKELGGFKRFIVRWDRGLMTERNVSYLRTTLEWLNYYENLKKYEIDHKKSSGAYLWVAEFEDIKSYKLWAKLTDDQKRETALLAKKSPGGTLVLPPGIKLKCVNPQLPKISETDTDILHMVTSGLNEPEDVSTGQAKGTFASVKASRGPMSDRTSDEVEYFQRFLRHDFWSSIFYLRSKVTSFPEFFYVREAVDFKNKKPVFKKVKRTPELLLDITFPTSEVVDYESRVKAHLGVKHGSINDTLGIANNLIAKRIGIGNYKRARLEKATEDEQYPKLILYEDQESTQEKNEGEPSSKKKFPKLTKKSKTKKGGDNEEK